MADGYSLQSFIRDMDRIILEESSPAKIVAEAKSLLAMLLRQPDCIEPKFKKRGATAYGRYMLHRAPQFNVTAVVWVRAITRRLTITTPGDWLALSRTKFRRRAFAGGTTARNRIMPISKSLPFGRTRREWFPA